MNTNKKLQQSLLPPSGSGELTLRSTIYSPVVLEEHINAVPQRATLINRLQGGRKQRLMWAVGQGNLQLVKDLVARGADVNTSVYASGTTPLMYASENNQLEILRFLVEHGTADVNAADKYGKTALMLASREGHLECVRFLVEHGAADVNAVDKSGLTALMWVAHYETNPLFSHMRPYVEVVRYLCQNGADPNIINKLGYKAIGYSRNSTIKNILLEGCPPVKSTNTLTEGGYHRRSKTKRNYRNKKTKRIARK